MLYNVYCICGNQCAPLFVAIQLFKRLEGQDNFQSVKGSNVKAFASLFVNCVSRVLKIQCVFSNIVSSLVLGESEQLFKTVFVFLH